MSGATSLGTWLETPRSSDAIVAMFRAIGREVAASHRAGVVLGELGPDRIVVDAAGAPVLAEAVSAVDVEARSTAPELRRGGSPDAASDQYALSVALRDALSRAEGPRPSRRLMACVERGMADRAEHRWPSMDEWVAALGFRPPSLAVPAVVLGGVGVAAWFVLQRPDASVCDDLVPSWTEARRDALLAAFAAPGTPHAAAEGRRVVTMLDVTAERITKAWSSACNGITPDAAADRQCVRAADAELAAAVDATIASGAVERMRVTTAVLGDPARCLADAPAPDDAEMLGRWRAELSSGADDVDVLRRIRGEAEAAGVLRIAAEARWREGAALRLRGDASAIEVLRAAMSVAGEAKADALELEIAIELAGALREARRFDDADQLLRRGDEVATRLGATAGSRLVLERGHVAIARGDLDGAREAYREAIAAMREELGNDSPHVAVGLAALARIEHARAELELARDHVCEAEQILVGAHGKDAPPTLEVAVRCAIAWQVLDPEKASARLVELRAAIGQDPAFAEQREQVREALASLAARP